MSLDCLENNLRILYTVAHPQETMPELISNWSGSYLYIRGKGFGGRFWSLIYSLVYLFAGPGVQQNKFLSAIRHTRQLFIDFQKKASVHQADYLAALKERSLGGNVSEKRFHVLRGNLTKWQSATKQWFRFLKTKQSHFIVEKLNELCSDKTSLQPMFSNEVIKQAEHLRRFYRITAFEGLLKQPLPASLLFKIASSQKLNQTEKAKFKAFIRKLNKNTPSKMGIEVFGKAIRRLVEVFQTINNVSIENSANLTKLPMAFLLEGCELFLQEDKRHLNWRKSLRPGQALDCNGRKLIIGELLKSKKSAESDRNLVYTVANDETVVISIAPNRELHTLKREVNDQFSWALETPNYIDIEKSGRFALVERLPHSIAKYPWKSNCSKLLPEEQLIVNGVKKILEWFIDQEKSPTAFCAAEIMFGQLGYLKFSKAHFEGVIEYNTLIKFVDECANGNKWVYNALIKTIQAHTQEARITCSFYKAVVRHGLWPVNYDLVGIRAIHRIHPHHTDIFEQDFKLLEKVIQIKKSILGQLMLLHPTAKAKDLEEKVSKAILICYEKSNYIAFLPENFEQEVIATMSSSKI